MVQRSNLNPVFNDIVTGIEKKTNDKTDLTTSAPSSTVSTCRPPPSAAPM